MIGIARRQTDHLGVRWIGIETLLCFKRIADNAQRVQLLGYLAQDCVDIHFGKTPAWP